jgi:hypothetical protein
VQEAGTFRLARRQDGALFGSGHRARPGELLHTVRTVGSVTEALERVGWGGRYAAPMSAL